jgi:hypothetical protein
MFPVEDWLSTRTLFAGIESRKYKERCPDESSWGLNAIERQTEKRVSDRRASPQPMLLPARPFALLIEHPVYSLSKLLQHAHDNQPSSLIYNALQESRQHK